MSLFPFVLINRGSYSSSLNSNLEGQGLNPEVSPYGTSFAPARYAPQAIPPGFVLQLKNIAIVDQGKLKKWSHFLMSGRDY